jgi:hypothetical protein
MVPRYTFMQDWNFPDQIVTKYVNFDSNFDLCDLEK